MKSTVPQQATWKTSDGSAWWLRDRVYSEPNGDYQANCFMDLWKKPASASAIMFNDQRCSYRSRSYYCQPILEQSARKSAVPPPPAVRRLVPWSSLKPGLVEEEYIFPQGSRMPTLNGRSPNKFRRVDSVSYRKTSGLWPGFSSKDNFAVRWSGFLIITSGGVYRFSIVSDDGSKLYIDNKYIINNDGIHGMRSKQASFRCKAGQHYLRMEMFNKRGRSGMVFMYRGRDTRNRMKVVSGSALRYIAAKGFKEEVFFNIGASTNLPSITADAKQWDALGGARMERVVPHVVYASSKTNWPGFAGSDNYACRWSGFLAIDRGGRYRFSLISDDGSRMFVNERVTVNNDGCHAMRNQEGIITLSRKKWKIKIEYFESGGSAGMVFRYMGFDTGNKMRYVPRKVMSVDY